MYVWGWEENRKNGHKMNCETKEMTGVTQGCLCWSVSDENRVVTALAWCCSQCTEGSLCLHMHTHLWSPFGMLLKRYDGQRLDARIKLKVHFQASCFIKTQFDTLTSVFWEQKIGWAQGQGVGLECGLGGDSLVCPETQ